MTIYCFFLYDKKMTKEEYMRLDKYEKQELNSLYALTNVKAYAKRFMRERDMSKFVLVKKNLDKEYCDDLMNKKRSSVLALFTYHYFPKINKNIDEEKQALILSTYAESTLVGAQCEQSLMGFSPLMGFSDPFCLREDFLEELRLLDYDSLYKIYITDTLPYDATPFIPDDESVPNIDSIVIDELAVFILNFSKYFK